MQGILLQLSHLLDTKEEIFCRHQKKKKKDKSLLQAINSFIGQNLYIFDTAYRQQLIGSHTLPKHHLGFSIDSCPYINLQCSFSYKVHKAERTAVKI